MHSKKFTLFIAALLAAITITGCAADDTTDNVSGDVSSAEEETSAETDDLSGDSESSSDLENGSILAQNDSYTVYLENLGEEVFYPQVSGMSDESIQAEINDMFKSLESERYELMSIQTERYVTTTEIMYSDESTISLYHTAEFYYEDTDNPASSATIINLNMETGEDIELTDIADTALLAEKIYNNDGVTIIESYENAQIDDYLTDQYIQSAEDVQKDIERRGNFLLDENKNIILFLSTSSGIIRVMVET